MSRVPGTFKVKPATPVRDLGPSAARLERSLLDAGALDVEVWHMGECSIICSRERYRGTQRWHVSIAHPSRYPTWDEIKSVVYGIPKLELPAGRTFAQLLGNPAADKWVDAHENCFHLYEVDDPL